VKDLIFIENMRFFGLRPQNDIEKSISNVISLEYATEDFCTEERTKVTTCEMGDLIIKYLRR